MQQKFNATLPAESFFQGHLHSGVDIPHSHALPNVVKYKAYLFLLSQPPLAPKEAD